MNETTIIRNIPAAMFDANGATARTKILVRNNTVMALPTSYTMEPGDAVYNYAKQNGSITLERDTAYETSSAINQLASSLPKTPTTLTKTPGSDPTFLRMVVGDIPNSSYSARTVFGLPLTGAIAEAHELNVGSSTTYIGSGAFESVFLSKLTLSEGLVTIGGFAFLNSSLSAVIIPNSVKSIGDNAFYNLNNSAGISSLVIGKGLAIIPSNCFNRNALTTLLIPSNVLSVGSSAFRDNFIASLVIEEGVNSIGNSAFRANRLSSLILPKSVISIGTYAFYANNLDTLVLRSGLVSIGDHSFAFNKLTSLVIPDSVETIGYAAFNSNSLTNVQLGAGLKSIGNSAFLTNSLSGLLTVPGNVDVIGESAFRENQIQTLDIKEGVERISSHAFWGNLLETIYIPSTVRSIGYEAFSNNTRLNHVYCLADREVALGFGVWGQFTPQGNRPNLYITFHVATNDDTWTEGPSKLFQYNNAAYPIDILVVKDLPAKPKPPIVVAPPIVARPSASDLGSGSNGIGVDLLFE